ncbi:hypothetical protein MN116_005309 [Schistosoma mekongi]|uniref:Serine-rich repeat protein 2 n=1 Tax=Schistosoma mekongi TaxID=38744 RepID=A0AAE2D5H9_SCHME|nr:hypothetical protein MN116_005309 [Schistosoma mekongi]
MKFVNSRGKRGRLPNKMPSTVSIERHKLNQAMYQKLKKYIMSKRKREQEEKAQDAIVKRLRREREESKRRAEIDTENLENAKKEILVTRKRIEELTSRRNELFQRLKQIASEETSLREKQKSETMAYLASMPSTQFGIESNNSSTTNRVTVPQTSLPTGPPLQPQAVQHIALPKHIISSNGSAPIPSIHSEHLRDSQSPHRTHHTSVFGPNGSKPTHTTISAQTRVGMQQPLASITNNPSATMAAVAAAVAAQQRSMPSSDSGFPSTAAAAAYFNVIASLANSSSLTGNSLGVAYPNSSVSLAEVVAALAASGLCSLPAHLSSNPPPISSGNLLPGFAFGNRASPSVSDSHQNRDTITTLSSGNIHSNLPYHPNVMQSTSMSKSSAAPLHHNPNLDFANSTLDTAKVCLAQLAAAAAAGNSNNTSGSYINQQNFLPSNQFQKAQQILRSLNVSNPLISPLLSGNTADLDISQTTSTPSSTPISSSPLLPPAPISYRGSITTGQSAQQIQLQQQAHQKQQHNTSKYMTQVDYSSSRVPSGAQNIENPHLLTPSYPASNPSAQGARFTNQQQQQLQQQQQQINANNLIMLNLTSTSTHNNNAPTLTNAGKCVTPGGRHIENTSSRNSNTSASTLQFNPSSSLPSPGVITSLTSPNTPTVSCISNTGSSVALTAGLAPFAADLSSLNYLTSATLAAAFQQQQQLSKLVPANNMPPSHGHSNSLGPSGPSNNNSSSGRRFF